MLTTDRVQPRRRGPGATDDDLETFGGGEPLETALTAAPAEVAACTEETARLGEQLTTPEMGTEARKALAVPGVTGQVERALLNASNLRRAPEIAAETGVQPDTLLGLCDKRSVLGRARRGGLLAQGDAADGKLMLGTLFRFVAGKVDGAVAARLGRLPADAQERRDLLADIAELSAMQDLARARTRDGRAEAADEVAALAEEVQAARDEVDYLSARQHLGAGREPDAAQLLGAQRHAGRAEEAEQARLSEAAALKDDRRGKKR